MQPELVYMIENSGLDGERLCGALLNNGECAAYLNDWTIDIPPKVETPKHKSKKVFLGCVPV